MKKIILPLAFAFAALQLNGQTFPAGFSQVKVGTVYYPTSMVFAPDGRIFVTEKAGKVKVIKNGNVLTTPFYSVSVDQVNERGLSSVSLDPNFSTNNYVYIYYTTASSPIHNRLSRVTASGDVALAGSEVVLYDFDASVNSIHNGGGMAWGSDGTLFLAVGNDNVNSNSQDLDIYKGKVLRINPDFSIPAGNPYTSGTTEKQRVWAYGIRNPWTLAIQPGTGKLFMNDVGEATWEEINDASTGGKNFGWPTAEGMSSNSAFTNPVYTYVHGATGSSDGCAITGGTFFNPSSSNYPSQYTGQYFFTDYCNDWINYIDPATGLKTNFATNLPGSQNYIKVGTDGNLYYFSISQNALYKIIYSSNNAPVVTTDPASATVPQGQPVTFTVSASGTPTLTYQWRKNGAIISGAPNASSYTITNVQPGDAGQYKVYVSNSYGKDSSNAATLTVTSLNNKPVATILTPATGTFYRDGDVINFSGSGTDTEDGVLSASSFEWFVQFHHNIHYHPGPYISPGIKNGSFSTTFGETSADVFFRLFLVVSDAQAQTDTTYVDIKPVTSTINLVTQPAGLKVTLEGQPHVTPYSVLAVSGMSRSLGVVTPQSTSDSTFMFNYWMSGGSASHNFTVTDNDVTLTAVFNGILNSVAGISLQQKPILVFPNPCTGNFTMNLNVGVAKEKRVRMSILNSLAQEVYKQDCVVRNDGSVNEEIKLNESFPEGIYTVRVISDNTVFRSGLLLTK